MRKVISLPAGLVLLVGLAACDANESNTGPVEAEEFECGTTVNGTHEITTGGTEQEPLVIEDLCVVGGSTVVSAPYVHITNSHLTAAPPGDFVGVFLDDDAVGTEIDHTIIDCAGDVTTNDDAASHGIQGETGSTVNAHHNELRNCSDGFILQSDSIYAHNLIHLPDNSGENHADGVQWSTEDDGLSPIHDTLFEWNNIVWPEGSAAFQYHQPPGDPTAVGGERIVVRYNWLEGGAAIVRLPFVGVDNEFYGNHLSAPDIFLCSNDTDGIEIWGRETGSTADFVDNGDPIDDDNVDHDTGDIFERADCP